MITLHYCSYHTDTKRLQEINQFSELREEKHTKVYSKYFFKCHGKYHESCVWLFYTLFSLTKDVECSFCYLGN